MNQLQLQLIENTNRLPKRFLQEIVDFGEYIKNKVQNKSFRKRIELSVKDINEGRVKRVTPDDLFKEIGI